MGTRQDTRDQRAHTLKGNKSPTLRNRAFTGPTCLEAHANIRRQVVSTKLPLPGSPLCLCKHAELILLIIVSCLIFMLSYSYVVHFIVND